MMIMAIVNPTAVPKPLITDSINLYELCKFVSHIPSTPHFVVIRGR